MANYANPSALVSVHWLAERLDDPQVRVIEIHHDRAPYDAGHIPGAVFWHGLTTLLQPDFRTNFDGASVEALLAQSGIAGDTTVVVYSDDSMIAPWGYWFLKSVGHDDVRVLDGGRKRWVAEGRQLTTAVPEVSPATHAAQVPDAERRATLDQVRAAVGDPEQLLLDVRTAAEYRGDVFMLGPPQGAERGGHIPGAVHLYYEEALNADGTFKSADDLSAVYAGRGVTADQRVTTYCAVGMRSAHTWFVLAELLGYPDVRSFDGSWNVWGRLPDTPIERGD